MLLADEPTGNLDFRTGEMIFDLLESLHRSHTLIVFGRAQSSNQYAETYRGTFIDPRTGRRVRFGPDALNASPLECDERGATRPYSGLLLRRKCLPDT